MEKTRLCPTPSPQAPSLQAPSPQALLPCICSPVLHALELGAPPASRLFAVCRPRAHPREVGTSLPLPLQPPQRWRGESCLWSPATSQPQCTLTPSPPANVLLSLPGYGCPALPASPQATSHPHWRVGPTQCPSPPFPRPTAIVLNVTSTARAVLLLETDLASASVSLCSLLVPALLSLALGRPWFPHWALPLSLCLQLAPVPSPLPFLLTQVLRRAVCLLSVPTSHSLLSPEHSALTSTDCPPLVTSDKSEGQLPASS